MTDQGTSNGEKATGGVEQNEISTEMDFNYISVRTDACVLLLAGWFK